MRWRFPPRQSSPDPRAKHASMSKCKCAVWGVRALARRNVGFRFPSLALGPIETLELRAALGVARAAGSRTNRADGRSRASRGAWCRSEDARRACRTFSSTKAPFFANPARKGREGDEDGGGLDVEATENACGFGRATRFLGYGQLVRLDPILIEIERLESFGFGFGPPRADGKNSGRGNLPNSRRTRRATRLFPD